MNKSLINLSALIMVQGGNALFPLIAFPYLFTVLDAGDFSAVVVTESVVFFILAVVLYSFDITVVKKIIEFKDDNEKKSKLFMNVTVARLFILLFLFVFCLVFAYVFYKDYIVALLLWFMFPLGMLLQSNYYHQAEEDNLFFSIGVVLSRLASLAAIYLFIEDTTDYEFAISLISGSFLLSGVVSIYLVYNKLSFNLNHIEYTEVISLFKDGYVLFLGTVSVVLLRGSNILILSIVATPIAVATYALAEKVIKSIQAMVRPLNQFVFPKVVKNINNAMSLTSVAKIIWKYTYPQLLIISCIFLFILCSYFINASTNWFQKPPLSLIEILFIMSIAVFFGILNYMFGTVGLSILLLHKYYSKSILYVGVVTVILSFVLSAQMEAVGAAYAYVLGELLLFFVFFARYLNNKLKNTMI